MLPPRLTLFSGVLDNDEDAVCGFDPFEDDEVEVEVDEDDGDGVFEVGLTTLNVGGGGGLGTTTGDDEAVVIFHLPVVEPVEWSLCG